MEPAAIAVKDVEHRYGAKLAVQIPYLAVPRGGTVTLLGPNGSGKSTLLRIMALLELPGRGQVAFSGELPATPGQRLAQRRSMTMVFQDPLLFAGTVYRNVAYGLRLRGLPAAEVAGRVERSLAMLGIADLKHRPATALSGGEAQKVALARCLAVEPEVLFLDEPTTHLDAPAKQAFLSDLGGLLERLGLTAVFVTHDQSEARSLGGRIAVLEGGYLRQEGPAEQVLRRPASLSLAGFLGAQCAGRGRVVSATCVAVNGITLALEPVRERSGLVDIILRSEDVLLHRGDEAGDGMNSFRGKVTAVALEGQLYRVTLAGPLTVSAYLTAHVVRAWSLTVGDKLTASFYPDALHLLPCEETA
ncbi:MAG: ABC transporter ATP-binding protein [bacterium]|nr:ABC transporter ATP-binding protein [bacterium]